ncbi:hypothetical protein SAMN05421788_10811 [Filimonas lacunae]|uniref:Uncharacterized protein n=1 Tax=Filimonas lacunae TaxID=477680 RepID=A0A173MEJ3_9BACT|nr:hypothetical protein [Filimonas lacunae]BAV05851.1 hypothetical protein FLA_1863 [Filimonas lacunae]SIT28366.1 hypothetical protein SAMN05421788_10811 [Filimonas lacunae]
MSASSENIKAQMQSLFSSAVPDANTYQTVYASYLQTKNYVIFQKQIVHNYIVGFRPAQKDMVILEINSDLEQIDAPTFITQSNKPTVKKDFQQRYVIQAENLPKYKLSVMPVVSKLLASAYMLPVEQKQEAAAFTEFMKAM